MDNEVAGSISEAVRHDYLLRLNGSFPGTFCLIVSLALCLGLAGCTSSAREAEESALRAQELLQQRRIVEARLAIQEAIQGDDSNPEFYLIRGRIEFAAGDIVNAFSAYNNARSLDRTNMEALQAVSQLGLQTGDIQQSLEATEAILAINPSDTDALLVRGLHAIVRRQFGDAEEFADRLLRVDPGNEGGIILRARSAFLRGDIPGATKALDLFSAEREPTTGIALTRLEIGRQLDDAEGMAAQFALLRKLSPDAHNLRIDEANFQFKRGNDAAAKNLIEASLVAPDVSLDLVRAAIGLLQEYGPVQFSQGYVERLGREASPQTLRLVAQHLASEGKVPQVAQLIGRLPEGTAQGLLAEASLRAGSRREAALYSDKALAQDSEECIAMTVRAQLRLDTDARAALREAQEAARECPNWIQSWIAGAEAYSSLGDPINARRMWRQGLAANQQNTKLAAAYVQWLLDEDSAREALAIGRTVTANSPALISAWRLYERVCRSVPGSGCAEEAEKGLRMAEQRYAIDLLPGERPPIGLFGRLDRR